MKPKDYKQPACDFLMLSSKGRSRDAFRKYAATDFRHHNIYYKGDADSLMTAMEENSKRNPKKICEIKKAIQENNMVALHSHIRQNPEDPGFAVVHIFRFENDKIAELWDIGQPVPVVTININGMF